jgi:hydrogenase nickel incorporation protein HypA/HybF
MPDQAMHELSIAMSLIDAVQEEADARKVQVKAIHLKLGALSGVVKEALLGSYEMAAAGTALESVRLVIEELPVVAFCPHCGERRLISSVQMLACPECHSPTPDIVQGKELEVTGLEIE